MQYRTSTQQQQDGDVLQNESMLFYEDFVKISRKKRSKSLDQICSIVLDEEIYERGAGGDEPILLEK